MTSNYKTWGGKRQNAGRKKSEIIKKTKVVRIAEEIDLEKLLSLQEDIRTNPFKVTNEDTLFQCYHLESFTQILGFLKVEITNLRSEFYHLERVGPRYENFNSCMET